MAEFIFKARDLNGRVIQEVITADSKSSALKYLMGKKYIVTDLQEKKSDVLTGDLFENWTKINPKVFTSFVKEFSFLLKSGISLYQTLEILSEQVKDRKLQKQLLEIQRQLTEGTSLSQAMKKYPKTFSPLFINMVKVGEKSGNIHQALDSVKEYIEKESKIRSKIKSAMTYPVLVMIVSGIVLTVMITFVFPKFMQIFNELGVDLPPATAMLNRVSEYMTAHISLIGAVFLSLVISFKLIKYWPEGRMYFDRLKFKIPVFGEMLEKFMLIRITRTMGALLKTGVPLLEALTITRDVAGNTVVEVQMNKVIEEVKDGRQLTKAMESVTLLPSFVLETIAVGEKSGLIHEVLLDLADHYDFELEETASRLSSILEPLMLLVIGFIVLIIAMAVIIPMFKLSGSMKQGGM